MHNVALATNVVDTRTEQESGSLVNWVHILILTFCSFCHSLTMIDIFMVNLYDPKSGNIDKSDYIALLILSGNAIKGKFVLNYHIPYWAVLILLLVSITLVFSSLLYLLPLAYSQKFYPISSWVEFGIKQTSLSLPSGIAVDPSSGNVYVADTANKQNTGILQ